jgi:pimeloyl-ACP methyl ester carboxylesterase
MNPLDLERGTAVPHGLPSPLSSALFTADFARSGLELITTLAAAPWLRQAPRGDGHAVLLVPGLLVGDSSMTVMHQFLRDLGYATASWQQGLNVGRWESLDPLLATFDRLHAAGRAVSLVGWSMGGLYARELARRRPSAVRLLVQLGTPFGVDARTNPNWPIYQLTSGAPVEEATRRGRVTPRPPVPTVSIWSRTDGHVDWRNCVEDTLDPPLDAPVENVEVVSSHFGLRHHPQVLWTIAQRLARASAARADKG